MEWKDAEKQCEVNFDLRGYTVNSDRAYGMHYSHRHWTSQAY